MSPGYLVGTKYLPITINGKEVSALISPDEAATVLDGGVAIEDVSVDEALFLSKAEKINGYLHRGAINKNYRARVMAALLLPLAKTRRPTSTRPRAS